MNIEKLRKDTKNAAFNRIIKCGFIINGSIALIAALIAFGTHQVVSLTDKILCVIVFLLTFTAYTHTKPFKLRVEPHVEAANLLHIKIDDWVEIHRYMILVQLLTQYVKQLYFYLDMKMAPKSLTNALRSRFVNGTYRISSLQANFYLLQKTAAELHNAIEQETNNLKRCISTEASPPESLAKLIKNVHKFVSFR